MSEALQVGWREWLALPALGIPSIKAKVDTGARTSALHAHQLEFFQREHCDWVRFRVLPMQRTRDQEMTCEAKVLEHRLVRDSGGHSEMRPVIETEIELAGERRQIEVTLADRDNMLFRMLLGRSALPPGTLVSPKQSFLLGGDKSTPPESI